VQQAAGTCFERGAIVPPGGLVFRRAPHGQNPQLSQAQKGEAPSKKNPAKAMLGGA
jgi:hypothetical protein